MACSRFEASSSSWAQRAARPRRGGRRCQPDGAKQAAHLLCVTHRAVQAQVFTLAKATRSATLLLTLLHDKEAVC